MKAIDGTERVWGVFLICQNQSLPFLKIDVPYIIFPEESYRKLLLEQQKHYLQKTEGLISAESPVEIPWSLSALESIWI